MSPRIAVVLSRKDGFSRDYCTAVTLTAEQYALHSSFRQHTEILGMPESDPRDAACFQGIVPQDRWWRRRTQGYLLGCENYLRQSPPRHIDVHNRVETCLHLARRFPSAAVSLWLHNDPQGMSGARTVRERARVAAAAHRVICVSEWVRARFIEGLEEYRDRVVVLPNTIDTTHVPVQPKQPLILFVGRLIPEKGALPFAKAMAALLPQLPGWQAAIVGADHPATPRYTRELVDAVAPTRGQVELMGFMPHDQVMQMFARATIAVVPSLWDEPFARTALEAMTAGCAVIASRRGGLPEVVGDAGILLDEIRPDTLAAAVGKLADDPERCRQLQQRAQERALHRFDVRHWAARLDAWRTEIDPELRLAPAPVPAALLAPLPRAELVREPLAVAAAYQPAPLPAFVQYRGNAKPVT